MSSSPPATSQLRGLEITSGEPPYGQEHERKRGATSGRTDSTPPKSPPANTRTRSASTIGLFTQDILDPHSCSTSVGRHLCFSVYRHVPICLSVYNHVAISFSVHNHGPIFATIGNRCIVAFPLCAVGPVITGCALQVFWMIPGDIYLLLTTVDSRGSAEHDHTSFGESVSSLA